MEGICKRKSTVIGRILIFGSFQCKTMVVMCTMHRTMKLQGKNKVSAVSLYGTRYKN